MIPSFQKVLTYRQSAINQNFTMLFATFHSQENSSIMIHNSEVHWLKDRALMSSVCCSSSFFLSRLVLPAIMVCVKRRKSTS